MSYTTIAGKGGLTSYFGNRISDKSPSWLGNWENTNYPFNPTTDGFFNSTSNNLVEVFMFRLRESFVFNTLTIGFHAGVAAAVVGVALYDTSGTRWIHWDNISAANSNTIVTATPSGGAAMLDPGTYYWGFACSTTTQCTSGQSMTTGSSAEAAEPWNHSVVRGGFAANSMSSGVMPATLGALTAGFSNSNHNLPAWVIEP